MAREQVEKRQYISVIQKENILAKCKGVCLHCGKPIKIHDNFTVEHFIPLSKGGRNTIDNLVALCEDCNKEKGNDILSPEFYPYAPKLLKEKLEEEWAEYLENDDWLTRFNIFKEDRFTVDVTAVILGCKGTKPFYMTKKVDVRKMDMGEVEEYFHLGEEYQTPIIVGDDYTEEGYLPNMYSVSFNGKVMFVFSTEIMVGNTQRPNALLVNMYVNPEVKWIPATKTMICDSIDAIMDRFIETMTRDGHKGVIFFHLCGIRTDVRTQEIIELKNKMNGGMLMKNDQIRFIQSVLTFGKLNPNSDLEKEEKLYRNQIAKRLRRNDETLGEK